MYLDVVMCGGSLVKMTSLVMLVEAKYGSKNIRQI